jgi:hypothetical protein
MSDRRNFFGVVLFPGTFRFSSSRDLGRSSKEEEEGVVPDDQTSKAEIQASKSWPFQLWTGSKATAAAVHRRIVKAPLESDTRIRSWVSRSQSRLSASFSSPSSASEYLDSSFSSKWSGRSRP